eukprot:1140026-Pelagomonas_calceolata.AAC.14
MNGVGICGIERWCAAFERKYKSWLFQETLSMHLKGWGAPILSLDSSRARVTRGILQPETLADRLLVIHSQPVSRIEVNSDNYFENRVSLDLEKRCSQGQF